MAASPPFDTHSALFQEAFLTAKPMAAFLETATPVQQERWNSYSNRLSLTETQLAVLAGFKRQMNVLVLAGAWCGDCARQGPMLELLAKAAPCIDLRFIDNNANVAVRDELRIHGAARVPVAVTLSEDFFEIGRYGDRTLAAYRRKASQELGDACDAGIVPPDAAELAEEVREWLEVLERQQLLLRVSPMLRTRHGD